MFHPDVPAALADTVAAMLRRFPATGIVWDELKSIHGEDHSPAAVDRLGRPALEADLIQGTVECFSDVDRRLRQEFEALRIACFLYADSDQEVVDRCAAIGGLDEFGCDGKCFRPGESQTGEGGGNKVLLGGNDARFAAAARRNGCRPFTLLETQLLDEPALELSFRRPARVPRNQGRAPGLLLLPLRPRRPGAGHARTGPGPGRLARRLTPGRMCRWGGGTACSTRLPASWPGKLRKAIFGSERGRGREQVRRMTKDQL